jgi:peptidoglycan/xylan/chitin deacetylase (PgdA/CDA1 family)
MKVGDAIRRAVRGRPPGGRAVVLAYHRVADLTCDPDGTAISPEHFAEQVEWLARTRRVVPLDRIFNALAGGEEVASISFDDAYLDFAVNALPVLKKNSCPATVFVSTSAVGAPHEMWWDELTRIMVPEALPAGERAEIHLASRMKAMGALYGVEPAKRAEIIAEMATRAGVDLKPRESHRVMNREELRRLAGDALLSIGAHGVTHRPLNRLDPAVARFEVHRSKAECEEWAERAVTMFAYPFGAADRRCRRIVAEAGFKMAFRINPGRIRVWSDPFMLPRLEVRDWTTEEFQAALGGLV